MNVRLSFFIPLCHSENEACVFFLYCRGLQSERALKVLENKFDMNNRFKVILAGGRQYGGF